MGEKILRMDGQMEEQKDGLTGQKHICLQPVGWRHNKTIGTFWLTLMWFNHTFPCLVLPSWSPLGTQQAPSISTEGTLNNWKMTPLTLNYSTASLLPQQGVGTVTVL